MTDYTAAEVEEALDALLGLAYNEDEDEPEEGEVDGWDELEYALKGRYGHTKLTSIILRGEPAPIEYVADFGGQGQGDDLWLVIKVGDQLFRKEGYYASDYGSNWGDGDFSEVHAVVREVTFYE